MIKLQQYMSPFLVFVCVFVYAGTRSSREKSNKAQAMKLLKAVQGRLGGGGGGALGGALAELGGGKGLVCVAPKVKVTSESCDSH